MRRLRVLVLLVLTVVSAGAQTAPPKSAVDLERLGPRIGEPVPDFRLVDQHGATRDLPSVLGPKGAMLVFF